MSRSNFHNKPFKLNALSEELKASRDMDKTYLEPILSNSEVNIDTESPYSMCHIGCAIRGVENKIYGKPYTVQEFFNRKNNHDAEWFTASSLGLNELQIKLILQYALDIGIEWQWPDEESTGFEARVQKRCDICYTMNVQCCKDPKGDCRSWVDKNTKGERNEATEYERANKRKNGVTYGKCESKNVVGDFKDCNCKYHFAGESNWDSDWYDCDGYDCPDGFDHVLMTCKNSNCDYSKYVAWYAFDGDQNNKSPSFTCRWGGKRKLCSTCSEAKAKHCGPKTK